MRDPWNFEGFSLGVAFCIALGATVWFAFSLSREPIGVETHWGGLGGGGGGWRASSSLVSLVVTVIAWILFTTASVVSANDRRAVFEREEARLDAKELAAGSAKAPAPHAPAVAPFADPPDSSARPESSKNH